MKQSLITIIATLGILLVTPQLIADDKAVSSPVAGIMMKYIVIGTATDIPSTDGRILPPDKDSIVQLADWFSLPANTKVAAIWYTPVVTLRDSVKFASIRPSLVNFALMIHPYGSSIAAEPSALGINVYVAYAPK